MMSDRFTLTHEELDLAREACRLTGSHWVRITSQDPERLAIRYLGKHADEAAGLLTQMLRKRNEHHT